MNRLKVTNDFIFQKIFGQNENKDVLLSFLNAALELDEASKLADLEIVDSKLRKDGIRDKQGILDIRAKTATGEQINVGFYRRCTGRGVRNGHERGTGNCQSGGNIGTLRDFGRDPPLL